MRILLAPNAFKGTLSGSEAAEAIESALRPAFPGAFFEKAPVSDGGDGLLDVLAPALGLRIMTLGVCGPLGVKVKARMALSAGPGRQRTAIIEMAEACGLRLLPEGVKRPMEASTRGAGELIGAALRLGAREIIVGLGGSASSDAGAGCAAAAGLRLVDKNGAVISDGAGGLLELERVLGAGALRSRLRGVKVRALADVSNALCGPLGSARVYGPQKGASPAQARLMEKALVNFAAVVSRDLGVATANLPRGAAAGGLAAGLYAFFGAELLDGAQFVLKKLDFEARVKRADLIITGEGRFDSQTFSGKAPGAVARLAGKFSKPLILVCGESRVRGKKKLSAAGITRVIDASKYFTLQELLARPRETICAAVRMSFRLPPAADWQPPRGGPGRRGRRAD